MAWFCVALRKMKNFFKACLAIFIIGTGTLVYYLKTTVPNRPEIDLERWWGIGAKPREEDKSIRNFTIDFNEELIRDLKRRLRSRRHFTRPLEDAQSNYGINTIYLGKTIDYWLDNYNFSARLEFLNKFPHYKTRVNGLDIHFIRMKPDPKPGVEILPLLMLHGWPSSSKEFVRVIPRLTKPKRGFNFMFEVIAPDLPGFGFSEGTRKRGLNPVCIGIIMRNLMRRLGFEKFYIQAGDWGSQAATHLITLLPDEILGFHTNMPVSSMRISAWKLALGAWFPNWIVEPSAVDRIYPLWNTFKVIMRESGYFHIQATKPDTIGVALNDSPAGLAAYIMEKMAVCSNRNQLNTEHGGLDNLLIDDVLDTVVIAWFNNCIVTSMRIYAEATFHATREIQILHNIPTDVPTAALKLKHEVIFQPDWVLRDKFKNLVQSTTHGIGGHFAGLQTPELLADDIFKATVKFRQFNAVHERNVQIKITL